MDYKQFKDEQKALGLNNEQMAIFCNVSISTVEKWRKGVRCVQGPVIPLLKLCKKYKGAVKFLSQKE